MNLIKAGIVIVVIAGVGKACASAGGPAAATIADNMRPRGDLCSPSYSRERYTAEHEHGADVRCEDEQP